MSLWVVVGIAEGAGARRGGSLLKVSGLYFQGAIWLRHGGYTGGNYRKTQADGRQE